MENLSKNQQQFIKDVENQGYEIDYTYSGRGMYGKKCPAVCLDRDERLNTTANIAEDSMGLGYVVYAPH